MRIDEREHAKAKRLPLFQIVDKFPSEKVVLISEFTPLRLLLRRVSTRTASTHAAHVVEVVATTVAEMAKAMFQRVNAVAGEARVSDLLENMKRQT